MTLFTAEGLIDSNGSHVLDSIWKQYQNWLVTQEQDEPAPGAKGLMAIADLYSRRAPGMTCLSAISSGKPGSIEHPANSSKGCGGIMRAAPIGLYFDDAEKGDLAAAEMSALTHGHELGYIPSAAFAHLIHRFVYNPEMSLSESVEEMRTAMKQLFEGKKHIQDFDSLMEKTIRLSESDLNDADAIREIGEGWVAEETLAIALFCLLRHPDDFEKALRAAVNITGDSDSTGAVTGNLLGARLGIKAVPEKFINDLELCDTILETADRLEKAAENEWDRSSEIESGREM